MRFTYYVLGARETFPVPRVVRHFAAQTDLVAVDGDEDWLGEPHRIIGHTPFGTVDRRVAVVKDGSPVTFRKGNFTFASSSRPTDGGFQRWTYMRPSLAIRWAHMRVAQEREMQSVSLEQLADTTGRTPDVLYMDVEGGEFDVVNASRDLFRNRVLVVDLEAQIVPMFEGQHLFDEILAAMRSCGFLIQSMQFGQWTPFERRALLPTKGFPVSGHVRFVKDPHVLLSLPEPMSAVIKAAALAIGEGDLQYAWSVLTEAALAGHRLPLRSDIERFVAGFWTSVHSSDGNFRLPLASERERFKVWMEQNSQAVQRAKDRKMTAVEQYLADCGLADVAEQVRDARIKQVVEYTGA